MGLFDRLRDDDRMQAIVAGSAVVVVAVLAVVLSRGDGGEPDAPLAEPVFEALRGWPVDPLAPRPESGAARGKNDNGGGSKSENGGGGGGEAPTGPPPPGSEEGEPVGEVPPGAGLSENERVVATVIREYLVSIYVGAGYQACAQLSPSGIKTMEAKLAKVAPETEGARCSQSILLYRGAYGDAIRDPRFASLSVSGNSAEAMGPHKEPATLTKYDNTWLLDEYGQ